ncbi:hypothetical protein MKY34_01975 [Sporosarcina sp. FSL K6-1522]|uniref:hypothetical protein n=1 Tax=Sporosarcina sp. FSL K6-1522 TaxID=2921554 RepID=UPI00315A74E5
MKQPLIMYEDKDFRLSEEYASIVQGLDNYFKSNYTDGTDAVLNAEGLVPVNLTQIKAREYSDWEAIIADLNDLKVGYRAITSELRSYYMLKQIDSLISLVRWSRKDDFDFRTKVRGFLFVDENPITRRECEQLHAMLQEKFQSIGLRGDVHSNYHKWTQDRLVPAQEIESTLNHLFIQAKQQVMEKMFPDIEDVQVKVKIAHNIPFSAYCDYVNETMIINGDYDYTYESLKHLATHEVFPGHTTHLHMREMEYKKGNIPADAALVITNTASSPIFEGIGDNGLDFIGWNESINDEISTIIQIIKSISGINSSYQLNELKKSPDEISQFLKEFAFGQEEWIESRLRFMSHPLRGPFIYSYFRGYEGVREVYKRLSANEKPEFFDYLYKNMLTLNELKKFR